jgi:hypothetical protein
MSPWAITAIVLAFVIGGAVALALAAVTFLGGETDESDSASTPAPAESTPVQWAPYEAPDGRFVVEMPGTPTVETEDRTVEGVPTTLTVYDVVTDEGEYFVDTIQVSGGYSYTDTNAALDGAVDGIATMHEGMTVTHRDVVDFAGNNARSFGIDYGDGIEAEALAFTSGDRIYILGVAGPEPDVEGLERMKATFGLR